MKCDDVQSLAGPYLDSELDVRTTGAIQQHLTACPECARLFAVEEKAQARLLAALRQGQTTPTLWGRTEQLVRDAAGARDASAGRSWRARLHPPITTARGDHQQRFDASWWRLWLWPSPRFYAGVAALWAVILILNFLTADRSNVIRRSVEPPPMASRAFAEQRRELAELLGLADAPAPAPEPTSAPPQTQIRGADERLPETTVTPTVLLRHHV